MRAVLQRVFSAEVYVEDVRSGVINKGIYILLGVEKNDTVQDAELLATKISKLRIFSDENGKMNLSVKEVEGQILVVSNFTLYANYTHGNRPDYFDSAAPDVANPLYEHFKDCLRDANIHVQSGIFGADMRSVIVTDGPVTIVLDSKNLKKGKSIL